MSEQRPVPNLMKALRESLEKAVQPPATPLDRVDESALPADVGEGLVHAGEGGVRPVLAGGRRSHGDVAVRTHRPVGRQDAFADLGGHPGLENDGFHLRAHIVEPIGVQCVQHGLAVRGVEFVGAPGTPHRLQVGIAQHHEPGRDR